MPKRKFYRDEENPYDIVEKSTTSEFRDEQKENIEEMTTNKIIRNFDEASRRLDTGLTGTLKVGIDANTAGMNRGEVAGDIVIWAGATQENRAAAPFRVEADGSLVASDATITGTLTASTGTIGGFVIAATTVSATNLVLTSGASNVANIAVGTGANIGGLNSAAVGGDIIFWGGDTYANRAIAPYRVTAAGAITATSATITGALTTTAGSSIDGAFLTALSVASAAVAASAITTAKIAASAVTASEIAAGAVTTAKIAALAVTTTELGASAVTTAKIAADAVTSAEIAASAVGSTELAAGSVIAGKIAALTIVAADIAASTITGAKIAATTITAANIAALTITAAEIAASTITGAKIAATTITAANIAALTITAAEIAANTITAAKIAAATITATEIAANTITAAKIAAGTITTTEISAGYVYAGAIVVSQLTAGTITSKSINLAVSDGTGDVEIRAGIASGDFDNTGAANGFIIGLDDSDSNLAKFYYGNATDYFKYNGSKLTLRGVFDNISTTVLVLGGKNDGATTTTVGGGTIIRGVMTTRFISGSSASDDARMYSGTFGSKTFDAASGNVAYDWDQLYVFTCRAYISGSTTATKDRRVFFGLISNTNSPFVNTTGADPLITQRHVCFYRQEDGTLVASMANGATNEISAAIGGIVLTQYNNYRIEWTPATNAKFYVNDVLKATLSTQLPSGSTNLPEIYFEAGCGATDVGSDTANLIISNSYQVYSTTV